MSLYEKIKIGFFTFFAFLAVFAVGIEIAMYKKAFDNFPSNVNRDEKIIEAITLEKYDEVKRYLSVYYSKVNSISSKVHLKESLINSRDPLKDDLSKIVNEVHQLLDEKFALQKECVKDFNNILSKEQYRKYKMHNNPCRVNL